MKIGTISWLINKYRFDVEGKKVVVIQLTDDDMQIIQEHASKVKSPNCYLEVGTFEGGSALAARDVLDKDCEVYAVDIQDLFRFKKMKGMNFINKASLEVAKDWDKPIGMLFIDGNHDSALIDFNAWEKFVIKGGMIVFHDYAPHSPKVVEDCENIIKRKDYELVYRPDWKTKQTSIFQIRKR